MATRRTLDLGTVGFGLVPNTQALEQSLRQLRKFGKEVERLGQHTEDIVQKQHRKFASIERTLTTLFSRTSATVQRMKATGVAAAEIDKVDQAYKRLNLTLTRNADALSRAQVARGVAGMQAILREGNRLAGAKEASRFAGAFRDLERAAILAVGPLSGVGARLAVLAALFESTGAKMTIFIAALTGVAAAFGILAAKGIKAVMDMERFTALLEASTGSAALVGQEYQQVSELADRLGQNIRELTEPYAKFTAAARLSNVALDDQRAIFEGAMVAGTAMRLSSERMRLVLLALEQMISKGTVSTEELRRQLGDLLPGSIALAARAMGKSQSELLKMIENGEVLASDLLPKLAAEWQKVFGPAAAKVAQNLQNELNRVGTATFEFLKAFDEVTGASSIFRNSVVAVREAIQFLTRNIEKFTGVVGALMGVTVLYVATIVKWSSVVKGLAGAYVGLRTAILGADVAMATSVAGRLVTVLMRVGAAVAAAAVGYKIMEGEQRPAIEATKEWIEQTEEWIRIWTDVGKVHKQTSDQMKQGTATRLRASYAELAAIQAQLKEMTKLENRPARIRIDPETGRRELVPDDPEKDPRVIELRKKEQIVSQAIARLESLFLQIAEIPVEEPITDEALGSKQFQTWLDKIKASVREVKALDDQIQAAQFSEQALTHSKAVAKAIETLMDMPEGSTPQALEKMSQTLRAAGFEGNSLKEQLAKLFLAIDEKSDKLKELEKIPENMKKAREALRDMFQELDTRRAAALGEGTGQELKDRQALQKALAKFRDELVKVTDDQATINSLTQQYVELWKSTTEAERHAKRVEELRRGIESLRNEMGDKAARAAEEFADRIHLISEAFEKNIISVKEASELTNVALDDMYRKQLDRHTIFGKSIRQTMKDLENGMAKAWGDIARTGRFSMEDMFTDILASMYEFLAKVLIIQPFMKAAFGGLYTEKNKDIGSGFFEAGIRGLLGLDNSSLRVGPDVDFIPHAGGIEDVSAMMASGSFGSDGVFYGGFASGGSFDVGGSGGTDSQLVAFKATPGERVTVSPPGASAEGVSVTVNINNQSGVPLQAKQQGQPRVDGGAIVVDMLISQLSRDAGARNSLNSLLSDPRH